MNVKETLRNLHKKFPNLTLDDLFTILDCYVSDYQMIAKHPRDEINITNPFKKYEQEICYFDNKSNNNINC